MSLVTRLVDFVSDVLSPSAVAAPTPRDRDVRLAAAALLVHVARVDGVIGDDERALLSAFLQDRFGLEEGDASRLMEEADGLDREVDDIADLVEMMGQDGDGQDRRQLLSTAYRVAAADGIVHEFEDDLVWRMGRLLGFDEPAIRAVRAEAVGHDGVAAALRDAPAKPRG